MAKHKPASPSGATRGRGRPSNAELALRAAAAQATSPAPVSHETPGVQEAMLSGPPEPDVKPILPPAPPPPPPPAPAPAARAECDVSAMSENDRNDPRKLWGQALRDFAHSRGAASRSAMEGWSDEKVREQVSMVIYRQYHEYA